MTLHENPGETFFSLLLKLYWDALSPIEDFLMQYNLF